MNSEISISIKDSPISEILEKCLENKSISKDDALCLLESKDIISILVGAILGDGHLSRNNNKAVRMRFEQGHVHKALYDHAY